MPIREGNQGNLRPNPPITSLARALTAQPLTPYTKHTPPMPTTTATGVRETCLIAHVHTHKHTAVIYVVFKHPGMCDSLCLLTPTILTPEVTNSHTVGGTRAVFDI